LTANAYITHNDFLGKGHNRNIAGQQKRS
jgi:hypothetical protein